MSGIGLINHYQPYPTSAIQRSSLMVTSSNLCPLGNGLGPIKTRANRRSTLKPS